ncbi:Ndufs4, NADH dehydrogenase Fe-S protein 4 [Lactarius sanguifluus]|nr:Ndufs4, NADH dehydrogenase Fe-S protein 4 [Lactarius sanguifluus]
MSLLRACTEALARPVPFRSSLLEPSEIAPIPQKDVLSADTVSGAPAELRHRVVRVYQPTRNTMQSGGAKGMRWRLDWDILPGRADYVQGTRLSFRSKEDAIHFAEKQAYHRQPPAPERIPPKNYSENFVYKPNKLRIHRTK